MRLGNLAMIACASALAAAAGCAAPGVSPGTAGARVAQPSQVTPAGAPTRPAATGATVATPPTVPPEMAAAKVGPPSGIVAARDMPAAPASAKWNEVHAGLEKGDTPECLGCHGDRMGTHSHPVQGDYAEAAQRARGGLRSIEEVRARGVVLNGGKVGCPTCHSAASPWAHFLAVPREQAVARPTMAEMKADEPEGARAKPAAPPKEGADVSARPLCESCHP